MSDQLRIDWAMDRLNKTTGPAHSRLRAWLFQGRIRHLEDFTFPEPFPDQLDELLARLCGYNSVHDMAINYRPETTRLLELLVGEHGYTVYKMLEARNGG